jgi:uncharacterized protein YacL
VGEQRGVVVVEVVRLATVLLLLAVGFVSGPPITELVDGLLEEPDPVEIRFLTSALGALFGYVFGGMLGRTFVSEVDRAEQRIRQLEAPVLVSGVLGALIGGMLGMVLLWPIALLPGRSLTVPVAIALLTVLVYAGGRIGAMRAVDLLRFVGARGRFEVSTPSWGGRAKLIDTSALIDGRVIDVLRAGFLEGTLVVPRFVLDELQVLADTEDRRRRHAGRRGLDTLRTLQDEELARVEVTDEDPPGVHDVDAKLAALARERKADLITVDVNLARAAEIGGVRVLNLHALAEAVRPPVIPGERIVITLTKEGREQGQGVGYLPDGTMVVVEHAEDHIGEKIAAEVTSLLQTRNGRMVFASMTEKGEA